MSFFSELFKSGGYSLPYLIHLYSDNFSLFLTNNDTDIVFKENTYKSSAFKYSPAVSSYGTDGGGSLEISTVNTGLEEAAEKNRTFRLDVTGVIDSNGTVNELNTYHHLYGKLKAQRGIFTFTFNEDDRLNMTFPALIWSTQNNRGNS